MRSAREYLRKVQMTCSFQKYSPRSVRLPRVATSKNRRPDDAASGNATERGLDAPRGGTARQVRTPRYPLRRVRLCASSSTAPTASAKALPISAPGPPAVMIHVPSKGAIAVASIAGKEIAAAEAA